MLRMFQLRIDAGQVLTLTELAPTAVSVLDDTGKLLSQTSDGSGADAQQLQYVQQIEQQYSRRILDILEPIVGNQNVKAQVTADVDFSQTELTSESHKPNQGTDTVTIRSQQTVESAASGSGNASAPTGVPGATSNQPPAASSAPANWACCAAAPAWGTWAVATSSTKLRW